jgi:hypothetical protein
MIREFLEHLRWEYSINHFENTSQPGTMNPELGEQLKKYMHKWNTAGLMRAVTARQGSVTEEMAEEFRAMRVQRAEAVLQALDALRPALEEAFLCASNPDGFGVISMQEWLLKAKDAGEEEEQP